MTVSYTAMAALLASFLLLTVIPPSTLYIRYQKRKQQHQLLRPKLVRHSAQLDVHYDVKDTDATALLLNDQRKGDGSVLGEPEPCPNDQNHKDLPGAAWNPLNIGSPVIISSPGCDTPPTRGSFYSSGYTGSIGNLDSSWIAGDLPTPLTSPPVEPKEFITNRHPGESPLAYKTSIGAATSASRIIPRDEDDDEKNISGELVHEDARRRLFTDVTSTTAYSSRDPPGSRSSASSPFLSAATDPDLSGHSARVSNAPTPAPGSLQQPSDRQDLDHDSSRDSLTYTKMPVATSFKLRLTGEQALEYIIPRDIRLRLRRDLCTATKVRSSDQCSNPRQGRFNRDIAIKLLDGLRACYENKQYAEFSSKLRKLVHMGWCSRHRTSEAHNSSFDRLQDCLYQWSEAGTRNERTAASPSIDYEDFSQRLETVLALKDGFKQYSILHANSIALGDFLAYFPRGIKSKLASHVVYDVLMSQFSKHEREEGHIYVQIYRTHPQYLKIGVTEDLEKRLKQWNYCCGRTYEYANFEERKIKVPYAARLEKIVHAELKDWRKWTLCEQSKKKHREWFEVNLDHVVRVVKKWKDWIEEEKPFEKGLNKRWRLRGKMIEQLEQICQPLPLESSTSIIEEAHPDENMSVQLPQARPLDESHQNETLQTSPPQTPSLQTQLPQKQTPQTRPLQTQIHSKYSSQERVSSTSEQSKASECHRHYDLRENRKTSAYNFG
ncbi:T5orf172 domain-containing protein [Lophiotrema nucula]|uniref:T5orf172 domain-containing protein n=1 Tax=Lophiotrema nucula TaxID=690887 RepID=A0A6A5ZJV5_9PLEO|nr:T5orf172 domain-containing protein [Lophiotrema nucula]